MGDVKSVASALAIGADDSPGHQVLHIGLMFVEVNLPSEQHNAQSHKANEQQGQHQNSHLVDGLFGRLGLHGDEVRLLFHLFDVVVGNDLDCVDLGR